MRSLGRIPEVGRFYTLLGDSRFYHKGSFLAELTKIPFFLLEVRESELVGPVYSYHADFIVGEAVYRNVLIACGLSLDLVEFKEGEEG